MDPNKVDFKSNKKPHFVCDVWEFYWYDMRVRNSKQDSWYRFRIKNKDDVEVQMYPHGFFWIGIGMSASDVARLQTSYAEFVLLEDDG